MNRLENSRQTNLSFEWCPHQQVPVPGSRINTFALVLDQATTTTGFCLTGNGLILLAGQFTIKLSGKKNTMLARMSILTQQLDTLLSITKPEDGVLEGATEFTHRNLAAARGCIIARWEVEKVWRQYAGIPMKDIPSGTIKDNVVNKERIRTLKENRLRDSLRPMKCDVAPGVAEILNLPEEWFVDHPDATDAIAGAICYARGI